MALINRYFTSKEGLFKACLTYAVAEAWRDADGLERGEFTAELAGRLSGSPQPGRQRNALSLLIRSSGDAHIDDLRRSILRSMSEQLAAIAGHRAPDDTAVLRAQILMATNLGIVMLRSTLSNQPFASASELDLQQALADLIEAMFPHRRRRADASSYTAIARCSA